MPQIEIPESFKKKCRKLPPEVLKKLNKTIRLLAENPLHPSLQSKPVEGAPGIYEARVDLNYRLTYERLPDNILRLRVVAKHDEALKNP